MLCSGTDDCDGWTAVFGEMQDDKVEKEKKRSNRMSIRGNGSKQQAKMNEKSERGKKREKRRDGRDRGERKSKIENGITHSCDSRHTACIQLNCFLVSK